MMRNLTVLVLGLAIVASGPAAVAAVPTDAVLSGELDVRARYVYGLVPCDEAVTAQMRVASAGASVPERATFVLDMADSDCGPRTLTLDAEMDETGWRLGNGETIRGSLRPIDGTDGQWQLDLTVTTCPPLAICEFPLSQVQYAGVLEDRPVIQ